MPYRFQFFKDKEHNAVEAEFAENYTWDELVAVMTEFRITEVKEGMGFIPSEFLSPAEGAEGVTYKGVAIPKTVGRRKVNVKNIHCVVLDYDIGVSIADVKDRLVGIRHLGYTSFTHLKDGVTEKFRVLIPLTTPCPTAEWDARKGNLKSLFPNIDESTFTAGRLFYAPMSSKDTVHLRQFWHADGELFDWTLIEPVRHEPRTAPTVSEYSNHAKDAILAQAALCDWSEYQDWLAWGGRLHNAGYSVMDYQAMSQSDRKTQRDCESWWSKLEKQPPCGMGPLIHRIREEFPSWSPPTEPVRLEFVKGEKKPAELIETITVQQREFMPVSDAAHRRKRVTRFVRRFVDSFAFHAVLRTPEGYGKSTVIVDELLATGHEVLFCALSHKQVADKMRDFKRHAPVRVWSTAALIEARLGVKPVMKKASPFSWDDPGLDMEATVDLIVQEKHCTQLEALDAIEELKAEAAESRLSHARLLVTTFATGDILYRRAFGKLDRVVVVDDPSLSDVVLYKCGHDGTDEEDPSVHAIVAQRTKDRVIFGEDFAFQDKVIWTTTEQLTTELIAQHHQGTYVTDIIENIDTGTQILSLASPMVRKVTKKILPGMHGAVQDECKQDVLFLANGIKGQLNLVNTKGRNDLQQNTVVAISYPHPSDVEAVRLSLRRDPEDRHEVLKQMVTDVMDQAIGRSQGYRNTGTHVLVLADPNLEVALRMRSRYRLNTLDGLQRRGRLKGVPLVWHVEFPDWWAAWKSYLDTWHKYIVVLGQDVFETFTMQRIGTPEKDAKMIELKLKKPTEFSELVWKMTMQLIEGDDNDRRNYGEAMRKLVSKVNEDRRAQGNPTGKFKFINPAQPGKSIRCEPEKAPPGWIKAPGRQPKTSRRVSEK